MVQVIPICVSVSYSYDGLFIVLSLENMLWSMLSDSMKKTRTTSEVDCASLNDDNTHLFWHYNFMFVDKNYVMLT
jgi:hypothetical protein